MSVLQWCLVLGSSLILFFVSPIAKTTSDFFRATTKGREPGVWILTSSLVISWIFAKSITNAANLGLKYGIIGGVAYATYYLSFLFAGIIIYQLRVKGSYQSIHHFILSKYGRTSVLLFSLLIAFRLFNEVWSNSMVIGSYFGAIGTKPYYLAILVFTLLTLAYSLKGGLKSALFTDMIQMVLFGGLLLLILTIVLPQSSDQIGLITKGSWTLAGGLDLLLVALVQVFSYPFHDPVMTDRGFITSPYKMRRAFFMAVPIGFLSILLFSLIGVYASQKGMSGQAAVEVAQSFGVILMLAINFIMITSASSTLDSAFSSFSKLAIVDLKVGGQTVSWGRVVMMIVAVIGIIPVFFNPEILSATTISGTMVIGLAPVFLFWNWKVGKQAFNASVITGIAFGIWYATGRFPGQLVFFEGDYGALLSVNILGSISCFLIYLIFKWIK
ncbi:MAG: sodium:solute symporter [Cyclobacteriaceae bacterium]